MMTFRVSLLGTGNPRPLIERFGPSILVEVGDERLLFDCGRGATQRLFQLGIPLGDIQNVFLTHLHSDHVVGLPDLWLTGWIFGRRESLVVRGPAGTHPLTSHLEQAYAFDVDIRQRDEKLPARGAALEGEDFPPGLVYKGEGVTVTAFAVDHGPVRPAFGYRIDAAGRSVVLSGDTRASDAVVEAARGADLLVHEVAAATDAWKRESPIAAAVLAHHTSPEEAGEVFARAKPRLALYSHIVLLGGVTADDLVSRTRRAYGGPVEVGEDLLAVDVGDRLHVRRP